MLQPKGEYSTTIGKLEHPCSLPICPELRVLGVEADSVYVFKSAMQPLRLTFVCEGGVRYTVIYKCGDDVRQDQLIIQMITLMDKLLKKENLDLKLTPYRVLATSYDTGAFGTHCFVLLPHIC